MALGQLMELTTRVDPLVTDLVNSANNAENSPEVVEAYLNALASVFTSSGEKVLVIAYTYTRCLLMSIYKHFALSREQMVGGVSIQNRRQLIFERDVPF